MSDIFREVDEDLRRHRAEEVWKRYGTYAIAAAIGLIVIVAGFTFWSAARQSASEDAARAFVAAGQLAADGDVAGAADAYEAIAADAGGGYGTVASMRAAGLKAEAGDVVGAVATYDAIAAGGGDELLRGLASIKAALLLADTASTDELKVRLTPLAEDDNPWRFSALELLGFTELRDNNREAAGEYYQALADLEGAPPLARERARTMLRGLQLDGPVARQLPADPAADATVEGEDAQ